MRLKSAIFVLCLIISLKSEAQSRQPIVSETQDPRGEPELVVCSQNLANYGSINDVRTRDPGMTPEDLRLKEQNLAKRFVRRGCDAIAVQEILGKTVEAGTKALQSLALALRRRTGRIWAVKTGESSDPFARVGFLVATDRAEIMTAASYSNVELPKTVPNQRPRLFARGPIEVQLRVKGRDGTFPKVVTLVNFHFKSKRGAKDDPTGLQWETFRMEMAEALRRLVIKRHEKAFRTGESIIVLLGDRNSNFDAASANILEGALTLKHFQEGGPCRLSKRGVALCQPNSVRPRYFSSVLQTDPQVKLLPGTFFYGNEFSWLDDILLPTEALRFAWQDAASEGDYSSSVTYSEKSASDHAMVSVALNW